MFTQFINKELYRINEILAKNTNVNIVYFQKTTKFGQNKFNYDYTKENKLTNTEVVEKKLDISQVCIKDNEEHITMQLKELNNLIIKLSEDINDKNYFDIVIYLQKNKYDTNNFMIDTIINEEDEEKKLLLIDKMNKNIDIDTTSLR